MECSGSQQRRRSASIGFSQFQISFPHSTATPAEANDVQANGFHNACEGRPRPTLVSRGRLKSGRHQIWLMAFQIRSADLFLLDDRPASSTTAPASQALEGLVPMAVGLLVARIPTPSSPDDDTTYRDDTEKGEVETRWTPSEILLAAQLGVLASQHHRSEYSCQKHGPKGAPTAYVPLSLQFPDHFQQLLEQQAAYADRQAWWPSRKPATPHDPDERDLRCHEPAIIRHMPSPSTLQEDLLNAISSSLMPQAKVPSSNTEPIPPIKTSQTHPLNISMLIPPEMLSVIAAHLTQPIAPSPTMFDLPLSCQLHRSIPLPLYRTLTMPGPGTKPESVTDLPVPAIRKALRPNSTSFVSLLWNQKLVRKAAVFSAPIKSSHATHSAQHTVSVASAVVTMGARPNSVGLPPVRGAPTPAYVWSRTSTDEKIGQGLTNVMPAADVSRARYERPSAMRRRSAAAASLDRPPRLLGNLFLSSCPGKKVRLNGPVNGRGGVYRDLRQDLKRIKELGVGCVVCCLDDDELQYLGAPWEEYAQTADELRLDVLRIPTPEGLAPADAAVLDAHLARLIDAYTLRGIPVLVHCRGGVGRAGLVACCWALKLGLCGWLETPPRASRLSCTAPEDLDDVPPHDAPGAGAGAGGAVRHDTLRLVERAIALVRRRRSAKAVETFEQVRFLAAYVDHVRGAAAAAAAAAQASSAALLDRDIIGAR
ncbi:uncharacterized protein PHACADRAFT_209872 [Phanerochaete carnosa HHB-10118-sp]|uniref:Tyrosine specific protein phosphatases domain-containing protein n=1 Tax=Phanerochaete carnosa (strain HHB-10118-sp) TaxID=650164 RepID=K5UVJ2_PHACS|nr:uncharacterized protein PHACADRAFT_209872 [Phanerochaete carnosa HHB-10118-sp]EKM54046.1 hypothetical protein PHACADRAFT_209872 [Phanerochaete carnosa HHB-10118-sp]